LATGGEVVSLAQVTRGHIEDYKPWLAARPGQNKARATTATITHRLGTLRMFFAVVLIGAGPWLHVPVGKLGEDRYLPLHPQLVTLIDDYRNAHVAPDHQLLLPRENGRPLDRHTVTRLINKAGAAAGLPHYHPHQLRHTLATQAINRGMSLEAIAAMLGHKSLDMTLRY